MSDWEIIDHYSLPEQRRHQRLRNRMKKNLVEHNEKLVECGKCHRKIKGKLSIHDISDDVYTCNDSSLIDECDRIYAPVLAEQERVKTQKYWDDVNKSRSVDLLREDGIIDENGWDVEQLDCFSILEGTKEYYQHNKSGRVYRKSVLNYWNYMEGVRNIWDIINMRRANEISDLVKDHLISIDDHRDLESGSKYTVNGRHYKRRTDGDLTISYWTRDYIMDYSRAKPAFPEINNLMLDQGSDFSRNELALS